MQHKDGTIITEHWTERDYAEFRVTLDESECMGDVVRIAVIQRIFGLEPTMTSVHIDRHAWERLMVTRDRYHNQD